MSTKLDRTLNGGLVQKRISYALLGKLDDELADTILVNSSNVNVVDEITDAFQPLFTAAQASLRDHYASS